MSIRITSILGINRLAGRGGSRLAMTSLNPHSSTSQPATKYCFLSNSTACTSCTAVDFKKWCAYIGAPSGTCSKALGGVGGGSESRVLVRLFLFERVGVRRRARAGMLAARIDWIKIGCVSVRISGVRLGIRRSKIVDCVGSLAVRMLTSVGYRVGK